MGKPSHRDESHTELMFKGKSSETSPAMQSLQEKSHLKRYCLLFSVWDVKIGHFLWKCPAKGENVFPPISIYIHNLAELMQVDASLYITGSMWWYRLWLRLSQTQSWVIQVFKRLSQFPGANMLQLQVSGLQTKGFTLKHVAHQWIFIVFPSGTLRFLTRSPYLII